ncbi:MAG: DUF4870 domain-containing protein [Rubrobacteraceae bacterium]
MANEDHENYGMEREPSEWRAGGSERGGYYRETVTGTGDDNTWSVLAHLSIFLNLFTGFMGPVAALIIWLVHRNSSPRISFHALQSLWYQAAWMVLLAVGWTITGLLMAVLVGFLLIPVMLLLTLAPFAHAAYAAYKVNQGVDYRYLWAANLIEPDNRLDL